MFEILKVFTKLGFISFGGPVAAMALMEKECHHKRRWISHEIFENAYTLCKLLPGPASSQLAIFLGAHRKGFWGGILAGLSFFIPGSILIVVLGHFYIQDHHRPLFDRLFYGMNPVVLAIIVDSMIRMGRPYIQDIKFTVLMVFGFLVMLRFSEYELFLILFSGLVSIAWEWRAQKSGKLYELSALFAFAILSFKAGTLMFGGGFAIIPLLKSHMVDIHGWLTEREFLDGLTLGLITPGPIMKSIVFFGYKMGGWGGALVGFSGTFLPSFIYTFSAMPLLTRLQNIKSWNHFVEGAIAAIIGGIAALIFSFAQTSLIDSFTWIVCVICFLLLLTNRVPAILLLLLGSGLGYFVKT